MSNEEQSKKRAGAKKAGTEITKSGDLSAFIINPGEKLPQRIKVEIKKFGVPDAKIAELKKEFEELEVPEVPDPQADKETIAAFKVAYEKLKDINNRAVKIRTGTENKREELKAPYLQIGKEIDGEAKRIKALSAEVEDPSKDKLSAIDSIIEERRQKAEREERERLDNRVDMLKLSGMSHEEGFWTIANISVDYATLKAMTDEGFENLHKKVAEENDKIIAAKKEKDEADAKAAQALIDQKAAQDKIAEDQKKAQEKLDNDAKELKDQITQFRKESLESSKLIYNSSLNIYAYETKSGKVAVTMDQIENSEKDQWNSIIENTRKIANEIFNAEEKRSADEKAEAEKEQVIENRFIKRSSNLQALGYSKAQDGFMFRGGTILNSRIKDSSDEEWNSIFKIEKDNVESTLKKEEEDRVLFQARSEELIALGYFKDIDQFTIFGTLTKEKSSIGFSHLKSEEESWKYIFEQASSEKNRIVKLESEEQKRINDEAELKRVAGLSNVEKIKEYIAAIGAIAKPEFGEGTPLVFQLNNCFNRIKGAIETLESETNNYTASQDETK